MLVFVQVVKNLARALDALSELNHIAWSHTVQHAVEPLAAKSPSSKKMMSEGEEEGKGFIRLSAGVCKDGKCGVAQVMLRGLYSLLLKSQFIHTSLGMHAAGLCFCFCKQNFLDAAEWKLTPQVLISK